MIYNLKVIEEGCALKSAWKKTLLMIRLAIIPMTSLLIYAINRADAKLGAVNYKRQYFFISVA